MAYLPTTRCGCSTTNTQIVCGTFEEPVHPDQGQCSPYRVKLTCEVVELPVPSCNDTSFVMRYDHNATPKFSVLSTLRDENCNPILDEGGHPIQTVTT